MTPLLSPAPTTAHAKLAAAVATYLDSDTPETFEANSIALANALTLYRIAEMHAVSAPFGQILRQAIEQIDAGKPDAARTCLTTLQMMGDFTPLVDLSKVIAPPMIDRMAAAKAALDQIIAAGDEAELLEIAAYLVDGADSGDEA